MKSNRVNELMDYMIDNGIKSQSLPLKTLTKEEIFKCVARHLVLTMEFRILKDLDKWYKTKVSSRSLKITSTAGKSERVIENFPVAKDIIEKLPSADFDFLEKTIIIAENAVRKLIERNKTSKAKILEDIETESGRKKLIHLAIYSLAEATIAKFGECKQTRTMENFVKTREKNAIELREIFQQNSWADAIELFQELLKKNEKAMVSVDSNNELVEEIALYNMVRKHDILEFVFEAADQIRENITGQLRIGLK